MLSSLIFTTVLYGLLLAAPQPPRAQSEQLTFNSDSQFPHEIMDKMEYQDHRLTQGGKVSFGEVTSEGITHQVVKHSDFSNYAMRFKKTNIPIVDDPGHENHWAGYLDIGINEDSSDRYAHLFFTFHESRRNASVDPVTLWLSGGPGCSSQIGDLLENGPGRITDKNKLVYNKNSWNEVSSVIYVDSPSFTGFSYGGQDVSSSNTTGTNLYAFLQLFYAKFPTFRPLGLHIAGESYAGTYIPYLANFTMKENKRKAYQEIRLKSIALGNGMTDPLTQNDELYNYACNTTTNSIALFMRDGVKSNETISACKHMAWFRSQCASDTERCYATPDATPGGMCIVATQTCGEVNTTPFHESKIQRNPYDIRQKCTLSDDTSECYPQLKWIDSFLNQDNIKAELGVPSTRIFKSCNNTVLSAFGKFGDVSRNAVRYIPEILAAGVRVLVYAGTEDLICDWMGNKAWTDKLQWPHGDDYRATELHPITFDSGDGIRKKHGETKTYFNQLTFLKLFNAGHMVPYDQPEYSLNFFTKWINNQTFQPW